MDLALNNLQILIVKPFKAYSATKISIFLHVKNKSVAESINMSILQIIFGFVKRVSNRQPKNNEENKGKITE